MFKGMWARTTALAARAQADLLTGQVQNAEDNVEEWAEIRRLYRCPAWPGTH